MQDGSPSPADSVAPGVRMSIVVLENWKAEPENPSLPFSGRRSEVLWERTQHLVYAADQQVILIAEMHVESRSADIRAIKNLLDDYGVVGLLSDEGDEGLSQEFVRLLHPSVV